MDKISKSLIAILAAVIVVSFFIPWISVESSQVGAFTKLLTGKRQAVLDSISGYRIPVLANSQESRFMISVIKIFNPDIKDADKKSYAVWAVPILAIAIGILSWLFGKNKWMNLIFAIIGILIFVAAFYKIATTDLDKAVLKVALAPGIWLTLWAYLGIGILGAMNFAISKTGKK